jgi:hypothetical protein
MRITIILERVQNTTLEEKKEKKEKRSSIALQTTSLLHFKT